jgi:TolA-binding protein
MKKPALLTCILFLLVSPAVFPQAREDTLFREGGRRFQSGNYELADSLFYRYIQDYPKGRRVSEAYFHRAVIAYKLGNYEEALRKIEDYLFRFPGYSPQESVYFWRGCILYQLKDYERAAADLGVFLLTAEDRQYIRKALLLKGMSEIQLGNNEKAEMYLRQAVAELTEQEEKAFAAVKLLALLSEQGKYKEAEQLLTGEFAALDFGSYAAYRGLYLAEALWNTGEKQQAAEIYEDMVREELPGDIAVVPFKRLFSVYQDEERGEDLRILVENAELKLADRPRVLSEFWSATGVLSFRSGKYDLAESYLSRAWRMRGSAPVADAVPVYLAELNRRRQDIGTAAEILTTYFDEGGRETAPALAKLGSIYMQLEQWGPAAEIFSRIVSEYPDNEHIGEYAYYAAYGLYKQEKYADAAAAVSSIIDSAGGGAYSPRLYRLQSIIENKLGRPEDAAASLRQYIPHYPEDFKARYELVRLYYQQEKYETVIAEVENFYEEHADFHIREPELHVLFRYLHGLSCIPGKEYGRAAGILETITDGSREYAPDIEPYVLFYTGWARYRNGEYRTALEVYRTFLDKFPGHVLADRGTYTAGWCAYTEGLYAEAADLFQGFFREDIDASLRARGVLMFGKSAGHSTRYEDAAFAFQYAADNFGTTGLADDALFEYAEILRLREEIDRSIEAFKDVYTLYPESSLAEDAMYKRGELLYREKRYIESRNAFYEYRTIFPEGSLMDAALYWGGMAFKYSDEPFGAVLLWERLIGSYTDSSFRPDALAETADIYAESGNLREALDLYNKLINQYPVEAKSVRAEIQREKIRNMIQGMSGREAELSALISRDGVDTDAGRKAVLELCRIYIYRGMSREEELDRAKLMLEMVLEKRTEDPESAARAKYLTGEYYYRLREMEAAANAFIEAATMYPRDRDFMASAMYRAAEITARVGNIREAQSLVERMEKNFPESQWSLEAKKLLEENR